MATSFRELPAPVQALLLLVLAGVIILAGELMPGLPIRQVRQDRSNAQREYDDLYKEVQALRQFDTQSGLLRTDIDALQKQLENLQTIVPDEKQVDEFIRALSDSAHQSSVSLRRLTAKPIEPKDYFYEVPFEVDVDGPYYQVLDFFKRLANLSRVINVGDIEMGNPTEERHGNFMLRPGTTVIGTFTATTYFTGGPGGPQKPAARPGAGRR